MKLSRVLWPWLLALSLLAAQALGFMHRVAHLPHAAGEHVAQASPAAPHEGAAWLDRLFAGHDDDGCRLFDAMGHDGLVSAQAMPQPLPPAAHAVALPRGEALARWAALFDARGPPSPVL